MKDKHRARIVRMLGRALVFMIVAGWPNLAPAQPLSQEDVSLTVYASPDGTSWNQLEPGALAGFFGPHRCLCPNTLMPLVALTSTGQTNLGASTLTVSFLLGSNCWFTPSGCQSLGQVSFSATQAATPPTFSSSLVFQAAASSASCSSLTVGTTTLWAVLAQDGIPLPFAPTLDLPVISKTVAAPTGITAQPADTGILVSWQAPADSALVVGYQVLCLPPPASPATAGYESCGLGSIMDAGNLTPDDTSLLCSAMLPAGTTQIRLEGLENDLPYTIGVVAIDVSGGVSAVSAPAVAVPQSTMGFYEKYKQDGGAASTCSLLHPPSPPPRSTWIALAGLVLLPMLRRRRHRRREGALRVPIACGACRLGRQRNVARGRAQRAVGRGRGHGSPIGVPLSIILLTVGGGTQAQAAEPAAPKLDEQAATEAPPPRGEHETQAVAPVVPRADRNAWRVEPMAPRKSSDDWAMEPATPREFDDDWAEERSSSDVGSPPDWAVELGISWYRPDVDDEFDGRARPYADTFANSRHLLSEAELVRYLGHRYGAWGAGLRVGYYKITAAAFLSDGSRSGDETGLRLVPCALSLVYRGVGIPGLRRIPLVPYAKAGLDGVHWKVSNTGSGQSPSGFSLGWHVAGGLMLGLNFLDSGEISRHGIADPLAVFFEWDYAAIDGLGVSRALHVGDSTWFAGVMFDI